MTTAIQKLENGTISLIITIPAALVAETREKMIASYVRNVELPGFRKGKAPKKLVEEKINQEKLREDILKELLPQCYATAIQEHKIKPIINPKIHIEKLEEGKDWQFTALTCEMPTVELKHYKESIKKLTAKSKIIIPGKEQKPVSFDEIVKVLLETITMQIPEILMEQEVDRLLSQTFDEIKRLGLTLDQYLASTGKTAETLRSDYAIKAVNDIKLEFSLMKIAEDEKISVEEKEIDEAIQKAKTDEERKNLEGNRYMLASILRQQKTLDFLKNL